jgi:hypothetical protein
MILVRLSTTWPYRRSEWMLALITLAVGIVWGVNAPLFEQPNYTTMRRVMDREAWAAWALVVGAVRLTALYINGAWRPSPHFRALGSFLTCFLWMSLFLGAASAEVVAVTVGIWPIFFLFDAFAVLDAAKDARIADDKARREKRAGATIRADRSC